MPFQGTHKCHEGESHYSNITESAWEVLEGLENKDLEKESGWRKLEVGSDNETRD